MADVFAAFAFCAVLLGLNSIHLSECTPVQSKNGFSIDLIHRDSQNSPFHNPSSSRFQQLNQAFGRSLSRASYLKHASSRMLSSDSTFESQLAFSGGEYVMKVSIGTPPVEMIGIADTGSDLTWTQCKPCPHCYNQNAPLFDIRKTSTYKRLSCKSTQCESLDTKTCDNLGKCQYEYTYGDDSYTNGHLATETFTFEASSGGSIAIPEVVFGCTHGSGGQYNESASGIVGLGGGPLSIVNQLSNYTGSKFSYCLVPLGSNLTSKIHFSNDPLVSGSEAFSTPLFIKEPDTFYYINLEGISVGNTTLSYPDRLKSKDLTNDQGNMIVDTGTTVTFLPRELYHDLESTLMQTIPGKRASDPQNIFSLCYEKDGDYDYMYPELVFHFTGADQKLPPSNSFSEVAEGVICLTMLPDDAVYIFGDVSMMNFLIEIDLENKKLSFLPADCTKDQ